MRSFDHRPHLADKFTPDLRVTQTVLDALRAAGFVQVIRQPQLGLFSEYIAVKA